MGREHPRRARVARHEVEPRKPSPPPGKKDRSRSARSVLFNKPVGGLESGAPAPRMRRKARRMRATGGHYRRTADTEQGVDRIERVVATKRNSADSSRESRDDWQLDSAAPFQDHSRL